MKPNSHATRRITVIVYDMITSFLLQPNGRWYSKIYLYQIRKDVKEYFIILSKKTQNIFYLDKIILFTATEPFFG